MLFLELALRLVHPHGACFLPPFFQTGSTPLKSSQAAVEIANVHNCLTGKSGGLSYWPATSGFMLGVSRCGLVLFSEGRPPGQESAAIHDWEAGSAVHSPPALG